MVCQAILKEAPDAGNPHAAPVLRCGGTGRFDEGKVASAKPRRGVLLGKGGMDRVTCMFAACAALGALAGEEASVLEVDAAAETTLAAWLEEKSIDDVSGYSAIHFKNTARVTLADELKAYAGEIRLKSGACVVLTQSTALGTTAGATYVEEGATLTANLAGVAAGGFTLGAEPLYVAGTGADGKGALQVVNCTKQQWNVFGKKITLLADTLVSYVGARQDWTGFTYTLNGHTLSVEGSNNCLGGGTFTPGHVTVKSGQLIIQATNYFQGGDTNRLTFAGSSHYQYWGHWPPAQSPWTPWTMVFDGSGAQQAGNYGGTGTCNIWEGPLYIKQNVSFNCYYSGSGERFKGYVYGPGKMTVSGGSDAAAATGTRIQLFLDCPTNAFTGGIALNYSTLHLSTNGALPATGGKLTITGGTVELSGQGDYQLPEAACVGTGKVWKATGAWAAFTKSQAGACVYDSAVGASSLTVTGGGLTFPCASVSTLPRFGTVKLADATWLDFPADTSWTATNLYACGTISNASVTVAGTLLAEAADCTAGHALALPQGALAFAPDATFDFPSDATAAALDTSRVYTLATAENGITGRPRATGRAAAAKWCVRRAGKRLELFHAAGTMFVIR